MNAMSIGVMVINYKQTNEWSDKIRQINMKMRPWKKSLLPDRLIGYLLRVLTGISTKLAGVNYIAVGKSDPAAKYLQEIDLSEILSVRFAISPLTLLLREKYKDYERIISKQALRPGINSTDMDHSKRSSHVKFLIHLIKKYKPYESAIDESDLAKIQDYREIYDSLSYVVTIDNKQKKKLKVFLKKYHKLYNAKELEGQQNYLLPKLYTEEVAQLYSDKEYIAKHGKTNLRLIENVRPNFCHSLMNLFFEKRIKIRTLTLSHHAVDVTFDNLSKDYSVSLTEHIKVNSGEGAQPGNLAESYQTLKKQIIQAGMNTQDEETSLVVGKLSLNLSALTIKYAENKVFHFNSEEQHIQLLRLLIEHKNHPVNYEVIAENLKLSGQPSQYKGNAGYIKDIKKNLKKTLIAAGMSNKEINALILTVKGRAYKLVAP